ncbi:MAG: hypothetical protein ACFFD4_23660 [Candidatus Odinarchaeota archaeon]
MNSREIEQPYSRKGLKMTSTADNFNQKTLERLVNHWKTIPAIKNITDPMAVDFASQEVRSLILAVLREGIVEDKQSRHALSAKELFKTVKKRMDAKIKLSNIYFHLDKLQNQGYVQIVTSIKEGRHITHYFGRTARLFLFSGRQDDKQKRFQTLNKLLQHFNPERPEESNRRLFDRAERAWEESEKKLNKWMERNEEILLELDIDLRQIYSFLMEVDTFSSGAIELNTEFAKLLRFPPE